MSNGLRTSLVVVGVLGALVTTAALMYGMGPEPEQEARQSSDVKGNPVRSKGKGKAKGKVALPLKKVDELLVMGTPSDAKAPEGALNVVFVVLTAARKDQLSPYGADAGITPFMNRMAGRGARFLDTVADSPYSRTASAALLSGRHSWTVDMVEPGKGINQRALPDDVVALAQRFHDAGWSTVGVAGQFNLNSDVGFARGFDVYLDSQEAGFAIGRRQEAGFLTTQAIAVLERAPLDRPFYLQVDYIDAHGPVRVEKDLEDFDPDEPNAHYRAALHRVDKQLTRLWEAVKARGVADQTLLVIVGDHGEGLETPTHHGAYHGRLLYESSVGVPWILVGPGVAANQLVGGVASGVDVAPTVLELAGLLVPDGLDGMSHAAQVRGEGARTTREQAYSASWHFATKRASVWTADLQCQMDFGSEGMPDSFLDACYDRSMDPTFTRVVTTPEATALMEELKGWVSTLPGAAPAAP